MKNRKLFIRIVCILLAVLLFGSGLTVLFYAFAADSAAAGIPATGIDSNTPKWPIYAVVSAIVLIIACLVIPKLKKK